MAALTLLVAACSSAGGTPTPLIPAPAPTATPPSLATPTPTGTETPTPAPTVVQPPPAPTNFTSKIDSEKAPCASPDVGMSCSQTDYAWQSTAASGTWFKIYQAWTGEGPATCADVQTDETVMLQTQPDATGAQVTNSYWKAVGGGEMCLWIAAVNSAGESPQVPAVGQ